MNDIKIEPKEFLPFGCGNFDGKIFAKVMIGTNFRIKHNSLKNPDKFDIDEYYESPIL